MNTVIVTGGAGFIGSNFVRALLAGTDARVVVIDNLTYAGNRASLADVDGDARLTFLEQDIRGRPAMEKVFAAHRPQALVNFAAESHVDRSIDNPLPFIETNIVGTYVLLDVTRRYLEELDRDEARDFRFLHVSTDEVYGSLGEDGLFCEETPYAPNSPYAASKASADHLVRAYHHTYALPVLITNCSNNYGPYQFPEKLIPLMILNALEGRPLPIYGDGGNVRDWLYVGDHCDGILRVLAAGRVGRKYNIGGSNERTNLQVVERLCEALERFRPAAGNASLKSRGIAGYKELKQFVTDRPGHDRRYAIDATRIRDELGWHPAHDFERGIEATVKWYLDNTDWCLTVQRDRYGRERLGLGSGAA